TAMTMTTSMPFTHCTVEVERATVSVKSKTRTTDQKRPPPNELRALSQRSSRRFSVLSNAASGPASRPSGDTYRIPGPHEAREVVAFAYDVKVDVLAQVEAGVLVRAAEAGDVEVEHDERRAAASHRLQQANPFRVRARRQEGSTGRWSGAARTSSTSAAGAWPRAASGFARSCRPPRSRARRLSPADSQPRRRAPASSPPAASSESSGRAPAGRVGTRGSMCAG